MYLEDDMSSISIGKGFTMGSGHIAATEGKSIAIGDDCMFSDDIEIRNGDSHSICDKNGNRINHAKDVRIGNHVWLTAHVRVLKGSSIADGSVIANSSIVTSRLETPNAVYGGMPVSVLKSDITWKRPRN